MVAAHEVNIVGTFGQIWSARPDVGPDGHISTLHNRCWPRANNGGPDASTLTIAAMSPTADVIATADTRGNIYVLRVAKNRYRLLVRSGKPVVAMEFSSRNRRELLASFGDSCVRIYDVDHGQLLGTLSGHRTPPRHVSVRATADELISCSGDGVVLWDLRNMVRRKTLNAAGLGAVQAAFSDDGALIVAAFRDDSVWVWDADSLRLLHRLSVRAPTAAAPGGALTGFALSQNSELVALGTVGTAVHVYDLFTGHHASSFVLPARHASKGTKQLQFLPDNDTLACLTEDGSLLFASVRTCRLTATLRSPAALRLCDRFCMDARSNYLGLVSEDSLLHLYDLAAVRKAQAGAGEALAHAEAVVAEVGAGGKGGEGGEGGGKGFGGKETGVEGGGGDGEGGARVVGQGGGAGGGVGGVWAATEAAGVRQARTLPTAPHPASPTLPAVTPATVVDRDVDVRREATEDAAPPTGAAQLLDKAFRFHPPGRQWAPNKPLGRAVAGEPKATRPLPATAAEAQLSRAKLRELLDSFGEYPERYRTLIWRQLLRLPTNRAAFSSLLAMGTHPAYEDLGGKYPLKSRTLLARLTRVLSALAHWSPVFSATAYLPALAFPFVKLFQSDACLAFESIATFFLNWGASWLDTFPAPPLPLLGAMERVLAKRDPGLVEALLAGQGGCQAPLWMLLSTLLTEVLARPEWLKAFDHVVSNGPVYLPCLAIAYAETVRDRLVAAATGEDRAAFLRRCNAVDVNRLVKRAYDVMAGLREGEMEGVGRGVQSLPPGDSYPAFQAYPRQAVDLHLRDRDRIAAEEEALQRRRRVVAELEERSRRAEVEGARWAEERKRLAEIEAERRGALRRLEEELATEKLVLDDRAKEARLREVAAVESAYAANVRVMREAWERELEELRREQEHRARLADLELRQKAEEEQMRAVEFAAHQRMWQADEEAAREAAARRVRTAAAARRAQADVQLREREVELEDLDRAAQVRAEAESRHRARMAAVEAEAAAKEQAEAEVLAAQLESLSQQHALLSDRRARIAMQLAETGAAEAESRARAREEALLAQETEMLRSEMEALRDRVEQAGAARERDLEIAKREQAAMREAVEERASRAEREMRVREQREQLRDRARVMEAQSAKEEQLARAVLAELAKERARDAEAGRVMADRETEFQQRLAHAREAAEREAAVTAEERARFKQLQEEMADQAAQREGDRRRRHEEVLAQLALEREKRLLELDTEWRRRVAREEMLLLEKRAREEAAAAGEAEQKDVDSERRMAREIAEIGRRVRRMSQEAMRASTDVGRAVRGRGFGGRRDLSRKGGRGQGMGAGAKRGRGDGDSEGEDASEGALSGTLSGSVSDSDNGGGGGGRRGAGSEGSVSASELGSGIGSGNGSGSGSTPSGESMPSQRTPPTSEDQPPITIAYPGGARDTRTSTHTSGGASSTQNVLRAPLTPISSFNVLHAPLTPHSSSTTTAASDRSAPLSASEGRSIARDAAALAAGLTSRAADVDQSLTNRSAYPVAGNVTGSAMGGAGYPMAAYGGSVGGGGSSGTSSDEGRSRFEAFFPGPEAELGRRGVGMRAAGVDGDDRLSDDGDDDNDIDNDDNDDDLDPMSLERAAALGMQGRGAGSPLESARSGMSSGMDWTLSQTTGAVRGMGGAGGARGASAADAFEEVTSEETTSGA